MSGKVRWKKTEIILLLAATIMLGDMWVNRLQLEPTPEGYPEGYQVFCQLEGETVRMERINVNTATAKQLEDLPDIGPTLAQRIVDYRTEHGPFNRPEDLCKVKGIGEKTLETIDYYITLEVEP